MALCAVIGDRNVPVVTADIFRSQDVLIGKCTLSKHYREAVLSGHFRGKSGNIFEKFRIYHSAVGHMLIITLFPAGEISVLLGNGRKLILAYRFAVLEVNSTHNIIFIFENKSKHSEFFGCTVHSDHFFICNGICLFAVAYAVNCAHISA